MKRQIEKNGGRIVIRAHPEDVLPRVRGLAAKLTKNGSAALTQRERDLLLIAFARRLGPDV